MTTISNLLQQNFMGFTGSRGFAGSNGFSGSSGFAGSNGSNGFSGSRGDIGFAGSGGTGFTGSQGAGFSGSVGFTGSRGDIGFAGSGGTGFTGSQGAGFSGSVGFTGSQGALQAWTRIFANHLAVNGARLIADTTAGSFTVTLPATPAAGAYVQITDGGNWAVNNLLINRNGSTIEGIADTLAIDIKQTTVEFVYDGTTWQFTSTTGARGPIGFVADDTAMIYAIALGV